MNTAVHAHLRVACRATFALALLLLASPASATLYIYDNTTSGATGFVSSDANCNAGTGALTRTFAVPSTDSFTVSDISLGLNISHTERGDYRIRLIAPDGTGFNLITQGTDTDDDYDVTISTNTDTGANTGSPNALDDNDADPTAEPYFFRLVTNSGMNFYTGNSVGTWTLRICDRDNNSVNGTFNRARLVLGDSSSIAAICTSTATYEWESNGDENAFTNATFNNITMTLTSTVDSGDGASSGRTNFTTQAEQFGAQTGYYLHQMDLEAGDAESAYLASNWSFSPAIAQLDWVILDNDNGGDPNGDGVNDWEDYTRVRGFDAGGNNVPIVMTNGSQNQRAGDINEGDSTANIADTSTTANVTIRFARAISTLRVEYGGGDDTDGEDSAQQRIGIGSPLMCAYDFGDAPTAYGSAGHTLGNRTLYMGANPPDGEATTPGAPGVTATNDDNNAPGGATPDDEDGVASFPSSNVSIGGTYNVTVSVRNLSGAAATLCGWVDWNVGGSFAAAEGACITVPASGNNANCTESPTGTFSCSVPIPVTATTARTSDTYSRFRLAAGASSITTSSFNDVTAGAPSTLAGEVEDYRIPSGTLPVTVAFAAAHEGGIEWTTSSETANIGFRVLARSKDSKEFIELGRVASESLDSSEPRSYSLPFAQRLAPGAAIFIEEIDTTGKAKRHGPFALGKPWGERPAKHDIDWQSVRTELAEAPKAEVASEAWGAAEGRILVSKSGIQRLTHADLLAAGIDLTGISTSQISLSDGGQAIARYVRGNESSKTPIWSSDSFLEFYFEPKVTLASPYDVLELRVRPSGAWLAATGTAPSTGDSVLVQASASFAPNRQYNAGSPNGDPWFDDRALAFGAPATLSRSFDLPSLSAGSASLTLDLWGVTNWPGTTPDHHIVVRLNGTQLESSWFDGLTAWKQTYDVSGRLRASGNQLEIVLPFDTGYSFDLVHLDGFSVSYTKSPTAENGRLEGQTRSKSAWFAEGFFSDPTVSFWAANTRTELPVVKSGLVVAPAVSGRFAMAQPSAQWTPQVKAGIPTPGKRPSGDYLIVTHPDLLSGVADLVALQQSRGFSVEVVTTDTIYAKYSDHAPSAEAIRSYIGAADRRLKYVLLVGAESYDPYDYLGRGSISYVPTSYTRFNESVAFGPSDDVTADRDGDRVPDVAIGRLPVRTPSELAAVVDKMVAWQRRAASKLALVAAGKSSSSEGSVSQIGASHAAALGSWGKATSFVDESSTELVRANVLAALNGGTPLVSYVGHSSYGQWDSTAILKWEDIAALTNVGQPNLVAQWGCWNAYFASPEVETLSNRLLLTPTVGAVAVIGSTALTSTQSHQALGANFLSRVAAGDATIGQALLTAKRQLAATAPGALDAIMGQALLGDPATPLPR